MAFHSLVTPTLGTNGRLLLNKVLPVAIGCNFNRKMAHLVEPNLLVKPLILDIWW